MIKFDIHSAYHFVDIYLPHTEFLGFSWTDADTGKCVFFKFLVLPFGLSSAPYLYTKLNRSLIAKWRGEAKKAIMFLDDGFATCGAYGSTQSLAVDMKQDLLDSGLIMKAGKCIWQPTQRLE